MNSARRNILWPALFTALLLGSLLPFPAVAADEKKTGLKVLSSEELRNIVRENRGKVLILNFWSTLEETSKQEIPLLRTLYDTYKDEELEIVGVNVENVEPDVIAPFVEMMKINYPVFVGKVDIIEEYDIQFTPVTFILGKDGRVRMKQLGLDEDTKPKFRRLIDTLLAEG